MFKKIAEYSKMGPFKRVLFKNSESNEPIYIELTKEPMCYVITQTIRLTTILAMLLATLLTILLTTLFTTLLTCYLI